MTASVILRETARRHGLPLSLMLSRVISRELTAARIEAVRRLRDERNLRYTVIARLIRRSQWTARYYGDEAFRQHKLRCFRSRKRRARR